LGTKDAHDPAYSVILDGLIARRKALGLTQIELALAMGTDQSQISKFERRERRIDVLDYVRFCVALKIDPAELLAGAAALIAK
jgi:transcriptional regulator with XRE-family HTH domain